MRKFFLAIACLAALTASAQTKSVSILGDSYSTFDGYITPATNEMWYYQGNRGSNDVEDVTQTWWWQFIKNNGYRLCVNNSWSGATICNSGYNDDDYTHRSFITRHKSLGKPDVILLFGGTNDSWCGAPIGEFKYADWKRADLYTFRPALAYLLEHMQDRYPTAKIYFILNSDLKEVVNTSVADICKHYNVPVIRLHDIDKSSGHPNQKGMKQIADQVVEALRK